MKILLTNDDGINSFGLKVLIDLLAPQHEIIVVAPAKEENASSHSLTLKRTLKTKRLKPNIISVNGTPVDCVILAVYHLLEKIPDILISGVNLGANLGNDVHYSGTVGAAIEGAITGIPSVAISFCDPKKPDFYAVEEFILKLIQMAKNMPKDVVLNVNIPFAPKGVKITRLGKREYVDVVTRRRTGYLIGGTRREAIDPGTDLEACAQGYISITPLRIDLTYYEAIPTLKKWQF